MQKIGDWIIYDKSEYDLLKKLDFQGYSRMGYVYILEYGDKLKIGTTKEPSKRVATLKFNAENYSEISTGTIVISKAHYNHFENEKKLHSIFFEKKHGKGELFSLNLKDALGKILEIKMEFCSEEEESGLSAEDVVKLFRGTNGCLPRRRSGGATYICFSDKLEFTMFSTGINSDEKKNEFFIQIENFLNKHCDYQSYKNVYEKETGESSESLIDICEYFQELGWIAGKYLDGIIREILPIKREK